MKKMLNKLVDDINNNNNIDESLNTLLLIVKDCYCIMTSQLLRDTDNLNVLQFRSDILTNQNRYSIHLYRQLLEPVFLCKIIHNPELINLLFVFSCYFNNPTSIPIHDFKEYYFDIFKAAIINDNVKYFDYLKDANINEFIKKLETMPTIMRGQIASPDKVIEYLIINNYDLSPLNNIYWSNYLLYNIRILRLLLENNFKFSDEIYENIENEEQLKLFIEFDCNIINSNMFEQAMNNRNFKLCLILLNYGVIPKKNERFYSDNYLKVKEKLLEFNLNMDDIFDMED